MIVCSCLDSIALVLEPYTVKVFTTQNPILLFVIIKRTCLLLTTSSTSGNLTCNQITKQCLAKFLHLECPKCCINRRECTTYIRFLFSNMKQTNTMMSGSQKEQIQSTMLTVVSYKGLPHLPSCLCPPMNCDSTPPAPSKWWWFVRKFVGCSSKHYR